MPSNARKHMQQRNHTRKRAGKYRKICKYHNKRNKTTGNATKEQKNTSNTQKSHKYTKYTESQTNQKYHTPKKRKKVADILPDLGTF
jgi:hypothetical protein